MDVSISLSDIGFSGVGCGCCPGTTQCPTASSSESIDALLEHLDDRCEDNADCLGGRTNCSWVSEQLEKDESSSICQADLNDLFAELFIYLLQDTPDGNVEQETMGDRAVRQLLKALKRKQ